MPLCILSMMVCTEESRLDDDDVLSGLRVDCLTTTPPTSVQCVGAEWTDREWPLLTGRSPTVLGREIVNFLWFSAANESLILLHI